MGSWRTGPNLAFTSGSILPQRPSFSVLCRDRGSEASRDLPTPGSVV